MSTQQYSVFSSRTRTLGVLLLIALLVALSGCNRSQGEEAPADAAQADEHAGHDHADHAGHDHADHAGHDHADHAGHTHEALPPTELPGTSIFHLPYTWTDTTGEDFELSSLRGKPAVLVMFYATCTTACPVLFSDAKNLEQQLPEDVREKVQIVFVTMDPERDSVEVLGAYASNLDLDMSRWTLLRGNEMSTRALAAVLGVQYRSDGQGHIDHTNRMSVIDTEGSVVLTVDGLSQPIDGAIEKLSELARAAE